MNSYLRAIAVLVAGMVIAFAMAYVIFKQPTTVVASTRAVSDVPYGPAFPITRTFLCVEPNGQLARDWNFVDRWIKPQLTYDTYTVDGRVYSALHIVTDDKALPKGHVRFRKVVVNIGSGPSLEGHDYLNTRINGSAVKMERELLFVEFNGHLRSQARPLPACGTPRS